MDHLTMAFSQFLFPFMLRVFNSHNSTTTDRPVSTDNSLPYSNNNNNNNNSLLYPGEEAYFKSIRQLTFSGMNAEAYFSFDNKQITFQATDYGYECDQIFRFSNVTTDDMSTHKPKLISTGHGRTTCSYFLPDGQRILYASTHLADDLCPQSACSAERTAQNSTLKELCKSMHYVWDVFPSYDVFLATADGLTYKRLTDSYGYDAEGTVSPNGDRIVYTSMASGDLELWTMNLDGSDKKQITDRLGYDGGAFYSPDGRKLIFRASILKTQQDVDTYKQLLAFNVVSPLRMELFEVDAEDGANRRQLTDLGGSNWAPFYHPNNRDILFSSNYRNPEAFAFQLHLLNKADLKVSQVTHGSSFNSFPMFTSDGKYLIFGSTRNASRPMEINLFLAEWRDQGVSEGTQSAYLIFILMVTLIGFVCAGFYLLSFRFFKL